MRKYKLTIEGDALQDIQDITDWYNGQLIGLGSRFQKQTKLQINGLRNNPLSYGIRYTNVRCVLVKKFPFLVHFTVDELNFIVIVYAVIHTSRNPKIWIENK